VTTHAAQVAASTQAAIVQLNDNRNSPLLSEYRDHLRTIEDSSAAMKERVDKYLNYEKAQQKFQQLSNELELEG
jgi:predicted nuclease with TOPRIM domain